MSLWEYANPTKFMATTAAVLPWAVGVAVLTLGGGLLWAFFLTPDDFRQGSTVKIMFLHVPAAMMAINAWIMMLVTSLVWLIRRHHVSALAARAAAPAGLAFTVIGLITGALWGQPMWGTAWVWDPRLTSFLVLCLFYIGYLALWQAIEDPDTAADLTAVLCLVGSVFALLSRYAVFFWSQGLHQGPSLSLQPGTRMDWAYKAPLYVCMVGFAALFVVLVLIGTRSMIRARRLRALELRERMA